MEKAGQKNKIKIVFMSNSPTFVSGYSKVTREVCQRLALSEDYEVYVIGEQYSGMPMKYGSYTLMARRDGPHDMVNQYLKAIEPDYFIWLEDTFTMYRAGVMSFEFPPKTKFITYIPQDGEFIPTTGHDALKRADIIVPMAEFTKEITEKEGFECAEPIYHGVDFKTFTPAIDARDKAEARKSLGLDKDSFVVLYVGRNSGRKLNQELIETFAKFAIDKDNAVLICHINGFNSTEMNLPDFIKRCLPVRHGEKFKDLLGNKIKFNPKAQSTQMGANEREMALLYRAADVYFSASSGEGFGMPLTEAMASGIPVVAVDFTTTAELITNEKDNIGVRGIGVPFVAKWTGSFNVAHAIINQDEGVKALDRLYNNPKLRQDMGRNGRKFVLKYCDWDKIAEEWKVIFNENRQRLNKEYKNNQKKKRGKK